jgi:ribosome-binding protein aMBF1 (putative translation factor)
MNWQDHKQLLLKKKGFRHALDDIAPELQIAKKLIEARLNKGYSQGKLAEAMQTKQSVISRVENAKTTPSIGFMKKLAKALDTTFQVNIVP